MVARSRWATPVRVFAVGLPHAGIANARLRRRWGVAIGRFLRTERHATGRAGKISNQGCCEKHSGRRSDLYDGCTQTEEQDVEYFDLPRPRVSEKGRHFCYPAPGWPIKARRPKLPSLQPCQRLQASTIYLIGTICLFLGASLRPVPTRGDLNFRPQAAQTSDRQTVRKLGHIRKLDTRLSHVHGVSGTRGAQYLQLPSLTTDVSIDLRCDGQREFADDLAQKPPAWSPP